MEKMHSPSSCTQAYPNKFSTLGSLDSLDNKNNYFIHNLKHYMLDVLSIHSCVFASRIPYSLQLYVYIYTFVLSLPLVTDPSFLP